MTPSKKIFNLRLFPNTGHQFFSIDLEELICGRTGHKDDEQKRKNLALFAEMHQPAKLPPGKRGRVAGWNVWSQYIPWILYRYDFIAVPNGNDDDATGQNATLRPALMLAIESNMGDLDRGILVGVTSGDSEHPGLGLAQNNPLQAKKQNADDPINPYFARPEELNSYKREDGRRGLWLEEAFEVSENVPLPNLLEEKEFKRFNFTLPQETVRVIWAVPESSTPVTVDLVVDLGNSRTVALLLEDHGMDAEGNAFSRRIAPVQFLPRGWPYNHPALRHGQLDPFGIIDSWILLHRSTFASVEPPVSAEKIRTFKTEIPSAPGETICAHMIDQRFTAISPVLVGGGKEATGAMRTLARGGMLRMYENKSSPFSLSSPKRYAWDDRPIDRVLEFWKQVPNEYDIDNDKLAEFSGMIRLMMNPYSDEQDLPSREIYEGPFDLQPGFDADAFYPRSHTICWFALAIIETAYRQMNSIDYINQSGAVRSGVPRRLRRVRVTYPTGWTGQERERYFKQWKRALRLFSMAHLMRNDPPIELVKEPVDEAITSQLPLVASEIRNLGGDVDAWLQLFGDGDDVNILSLDIGGGTTDIAVVGYKRAAGGLEFNIVHRDGHNRAGDELVRLLIERLLLPKWLKANGDILFIDNKDACDSLQSFFKNPGEKADNETLLAKVVRLALIPVANKILAQVNKAENDGLSTIEVPVGRVADPDAIRDLNKLAIEHLYNRRIPLPAELSAAARRTEEERIAWIEKSAAEKPPKNLPFHPDATLEFDLKDIYAIIDEVFVEVVRDLAEVVSEKSVDLVVVSGKPSELGHMRTILRKELPLPGQRIIRICEQWVGDFLPVSLALNGRIRDAKTATAIGAALYEDILNRNTTDLSLSKAAPKADASDGSTWGIYKPVGLGGMIDEDSASVMTPAMKEVTYVQLPLFTAFGRKLTPTSAAEPVYRLDYLASTKAEEDNAKQSRVKVTIRRVVQPDGLGDTLELDPQSVEFENGEPLDPACVKLQLRTIIGNSFWMDQPHFDVDFSNVGVKK